MNPIPVNGHVLLVPSESPHLNVTSSGIEVPKEAVIAGRAIRAISIAPGPRSWRHAPPSRSVARP